MESNGSVEFCVMSFEFTDAHQRRRQLKTQNQKLKTVRSSVVLHVPRRGRDVPLRGEKPVRTTKNTKNAKNDTERLCPRTKAKGRRMKDEGRRAKGEGSARGLGLCAGVRTCVSAGAKVRQISRFENGVGFLGTGCL
jgi:hypothetical protein